MATAALPDAPRENALGAFDRDLLMWIAVGAVAVVTVLLRGELPWLVRYPAEWVIPFSDWVNAFMNWFVPNVKWFFRALNWLLTWPMVGLRELLTWLPCCTCFWSAIGPRA